MSIVEQMLARYPTGSREDQVHALREVMQEIALAGLYRKRRSTVVLVCEFSTGYHDFLKTLIFLCYNRMPSSSWSDISMRYGMSLLHLVLRSNWQKRKRLPSQRWSPPF